MRTAEFTVWCDFLGQRTFRVDYGTWVDGSLDFNNLRMKNGECWFEVHDYFDKEAVEDAIAEDVNERRIANAEP